MAVEEVETAGLARLGGIVPLVVATHRHGDLLVRAEFLDQCSVGVIEELGDQPIDGDLAHPVVLVPLLSKGRAI